MGDFANWSLNLGRWQGIHVRVHALFFLTAALAFYFLTREPAPHADWYTALGLLILFVSVLAHEFGHAAASLRASGNAELALVGPLGGLSWPTMPHEPHLELLSALAGPAINLAVWLVTAPMLLLAGVNLLDLLHPVQPQNLVDPAAPWLTGMKLICWINWLLFLVNLLPVYPFDGARVLRTLLWPAIGYHRSMMVVTWGTKVTAIALAVAAWVVSDISPASIVPPWFALSLVAIFLFFSAPNEVDRNDDPEPDGDMLSYDFSQGYTSLERSLDSTPNEPGLLRRWLSERRNARQRRRRQIEQEEEMQVDDILARLHELGLSALTPAERALLERVSARYRNRLGS